MNFLLILTLVLLARATAVPTSADPESLPTLPHETTTFPPAAIVRAPIQGPVIFQVRDPKLLEVCPVREELSEVECEDTPDTCWVAGGPDIDCPSDEICCNNGCSQVCHKGQLVECEILYKIAHKAVNRTICQPETKEVCGPSDCRIKCINKHTSATLDTPKEVCEPAPEPICRTVQTPVYEESTKEIQVEEPKCVMIVEERCAAGEEEVCRDVEEEVCQSEEEQTELPEPQEREECVEESERICKTETARQCKTVYHDKDQTKSYEQVCEPRQEKICKRVPSCVDVPICVQRIKIVNGEHDTRMECETERRCTEDGYLIECQVSVQSSCRQQERKIHVPREVCVDVPKEVCHQHPKKVCRTVKIESGDDDATRGQKCEKKKVTRCESVPAWKCVDEPKEVCTSETVTKTVPVTGLSYRSEEHCAPAAEPKCTTERETETAVDNQKSCDLECEEEVCKDVTEDVCKVVSVMNKVRVAYERCVDAETREHVGDYDTVAVEKLKEGNDVPAEKKAEEVVDQSEEAEEVDQSEEEEEEDDYNYIWEPEN